MLTFDVAKTFFHVQLAAMYSGKQVSRSHKFSDLRTRVDVTLVWNSVPRKSRYITVTVSKEAIHELG